MATKSKNPTYRDFPKNFPLTMDTVQSTYSGKDGRCCCGCSGKHTYVKKHQAAASKNRGYKVTDDECNDRVVQRTLNIINEQPFNKVTIDTNNVSVVIGSRLYIAYLLNDIF